MTTFDHLRFRAPAPVAISHDPALGTFFAPQFRQQENQVHGLDRELWPELSDKMKERLGFKPWNAYGRLENPTAPWIAPDPERIPD